jgi:hypothetical protein
MSLAPTRWLDGRRLSCRGEEGEIVPGDLSEDLDDVGGCGFGGGVVEL